MNKCYTKVWNASLGQVVVASELASGDTVVGSSAGKSPRTAFGTALAVNVLALALAAAGATGLSFIAAPAAHAADVVCVDAAGNVVPSQTATGGNTVACGDGATAVTPGSIAIGSGSKAGTTDGTYTTAPIDSTPGQTTTTNVASAGPNAIAIGAGAKASAMDGIAIGTGARVYQGWNFDPSGKAVANNYGIAIGSQATAINNNIVIGNVSNPPSAIVAGSNTNPKNINNITMGNGAGSGVSGNENVILGYEAAKNMSSYGANVAIGKNAATNATFAGGIVMGENAGSNAAGTYNIAIGSAAGVGVTKGAGNPRNPATCGPAWGAYCPGGANDGENNTAIGARAGEYVSGANNTSIGYRANSNLVGLNNVGIGTSVANGNASGNANVWIGTQTATGSNGNQNTAVGNYSGVGVIGNNNTALGNTAGNTITTSNNTAVGNAAGQSVSVGNGNAAVGAGSGSIVAGGNNAAIGFTAGSSVTGSANVAAGNLAGSYVTGDWNVAIGRQAGKGVAGTPLVANRTIAVGNVSSARSDDSIAIGSDTVAGTTTGKAKAIAIGTGAQATGDQSISIGTGNKVSGDRSGAIGDPTVIDGADSYSVGNNNNIATGQTDVFVFGNNITKTASYGVALGSNTAVSIANGVALGAYSNATVAAGAKGFVPAAAIAAGAAAIQATNSTNLGAVSVGTGAAGGNRQIVNVAAGTNDSDAVNVSQLKAVASAAAAGQTHYYSVNDGGVQKNNYNNDGAKATNSLAAGTSAYANGVNSVAVGNNAQVIQQTLMAPTSKVDATPKDVSGAPTNAVAIGNNAQASAGSAIAIGDGAKVLNGWNFDLTKAGNPSVANNYGIAIGTGATAIGNNMVIGGQGAENQRFAGQNTNPNNINNITMGNGAGGNLQGNENIIMGYQAGNNVSGAGGNIIFGKNAGANLTNVYNTINIGTDAGSGTKASGNIAMGSGAGTNVQALVGSPGATRTPTGGWTGWGPLYCAQGLDPNCYTAANMPFWASNLDGVQNVAIGNRAGTNVYGAANVGLGYRGGDLTNGFSNVGVGSFAGGMTLGSHNVAVGTDAGAYGTNGNANTAVGAGAGMTVVGGNNTALGANSGAGVTGDKNISVGHGANAATNANRTIAIGADDGTNITKATKDDAIAIGTATAATGLQSIAIGYKGNVSGDHSISIGDPNTISGSYSGVLGNNNTVANNKTFVVGNSVTTTQDNSVVLGNLSTDRAATTETTGTVNGITYGTFAGPGSAANGVVSVGAVGAERQIINVAAGKIAADSTDAINGSQLYLTQQALGNVASTTATNLGGGTTVNPDGTLTSPTYNVVNVAGDTVNTANNVGGAITNLNNYVNIGFGVLDSSGNVATTITPGGTIQFVDGKNTTAVVTSGTNGTTVTFDVALDPNASKGWDITAQGKNLTNVAPGAKVDLNNTDGNIVVEKTDASNDVTFNLAKNIAVDSVNAGGTVINNNGMTLTGGTSITNNAINVAGGTAINMGGNVINNVGAGTISSGSTTAVTGDQIYQNNVNIAQYYGGGSTVDSNGNITAPTYNIVNANGATYNTSNNVGDAITNLNNYVNEGWTVQGNGTDVNKVTPGSKVNFVNGVGTTAVVTDAGNGVSNVTFNVSAQGTVNNAQLPVVYTDQNGTKVYLQPDGSYNTAVDGTGLTIPQSSVIASMNNAANSSTTPMVLNNVGAGDLNAGSTQAVNGSQINTLGSSIANNLGGGSTFDPTTGTVTAPSYTVIAGNPSTGTSTTVNNVGAAIDNLNQAVQQPITFTGDSGTPTVAPLGSTVAVSGGATGPLTTGNIGVVANGSGGLSVQLAKDVKGLDSIEAGGTVVNNNGVTTSNGNVYGNNLTLQGGTVVNMGGNVITNVGAGTAPTDAVNVSQLEQVSNIANKGWNVTTAATGTGIANGTTVSNVAPGDTHTITAGDNIVTTQSGNNVTVAVNPDLNVTSVTTGDTKMTDNGVVINGGPSMTKDGIDAAGNKIVNVAPGDINASSTDAVNGSQLYGLGAQVANSLGGGTTYVDGTLTTVLNVGGNTYNNVNDALNAVTQVAGGGWNISANGKNTTNVGPTESVDLRNTDGNIVVTKTSDSNDVTFNLAKNITVDSVKAGNTTVSNNGLTIVGGPSVTTDGINAGGKVISNVAAGVADTDAVNVSQLNKGLANAITTANSYTDARVNQIQQDVWNLGGRVDKLEDNMHAGVATAMALKQAPYVPGKTTYFAGAAAYKSQGAVGVSLRRTADNGRWSLEGGFSSNKDGTGVFVGVSGVLGGD